MKETRIIQTTYRDKNKRKVKEKKKEKADEEQGKRREEAEKDDDIVGVGNYVNTHRTCSGRGRLSL